MKVLFILSCLIITASTCTIKRRSVSQPTQSQKPAVHVVDATEFKKLIDSGGGIVLDVRTPEEIDQGYIQNASTIDYYDTAFVRKINLIPKDKAVYVYCKSGGRSWEAATILIQNGFSEVYNLKGGIDAWEAKGYPIAGPEINTDNHIQQVTLADFKALLTTSKPVLVDFHTVWCAPCRKMAPVIDSLEKEFKTTAVVMRIDADNSKELAATYKITGVPVFILFKNGNAVWEQHGIVDAKVLREQITKHQ